MAASMSMASSKFVFLLALFTALKPPLVNSAEFEVGDTNGWAVPSSKDDQTYNRWASRNRFQVNDTIRFQYKKDSVMEVSSDAYEKCLSSHPLFFSNSGDSVFKFNRSGLFYFISGVAGHCEKGQKLIIKVLETRDSQTTPPSSLPNVPDQSGAVASTAVKVVQFTVAFLSSFFWI